VEVRDTVALAHFIRMQKGVPTSPAESKTYIISTTSTSGCPQEMYSFRGTFRELLIELLGYTGGDFSDELLETGKSIVDPPTEDLEKHFTTNNIGDGDVLYQVYCVEDEKKVL